VADRPLRWLALGWVLGVATTVVLGGGVAIFLTALRHADEQAARAREQRILVVPSASDVAPLRATVHRRDLPTATLTVHTDGCGVIRSEVSPSVDNLTWRIEDRDGFQVLGRNAEGETRYRYFGSGTFTVVLEAFDGTGYVPISNRVTITC
jgi:hypothetical protein